MSKRKYTKLQEIEAEIMSMRETGQTLREIAEHFGLEKKQLKNSAYYEEIRSSVRNPSPKKVAADGTATPQVRKFVEQRVSQ